MKIISDYKDYYDSLASSHFDDELVLFRKRQQMEKFPKHLFPIFSHLNESWLPEDIAEQGGRHFILVAGKIYPVVYYLVNTHHKTIYYYFYNADSTMRFLAKNHGKYKKNAKNWEKNWIYSFLIRAKK